mgnify:CR=1 FL=1
MKFKLYLLTFIFMLSSAFVINAQQSDDSAESVNSVSRKNEKVVHAPASVTVIGSEEIENRPTTNVSQLLDRVVGLSLEQHGANKYNVTMRSAASVKGTTTLFMLDGRIISEIGMNTFDAANSSLSGLDLERIEVVRSASSSTMYGPNSGIIHFVSKDPFSYPGTSVEISSGGRSNGNTLLGEGNWDTFSASMRHAAAKNDGKFGYKINVRYSEAGEFLRSDDNIAQNGGSQLLDKGDGFNADATLYFRPNANTHVSAQAGVTSFKGMSWSEIHGEASEKSIDHFFSANVKSGGLTAHYSYLISEPAEGLFHVPGSLEYTENGFGSYYRATDDGGFSNKIDHDQHHTLIQYDYSLGEMDTNVSLGAEAKVANFNSHGGVLGNGNHEYRTTAGFFNSTSALHSKVDLILGGRYEQFGHINEAGFSYNAGLLIKPNSNSSIRISASQAARGDDVMALYQNHSLSPWGAAMTHVRGNVNQLTFNNPMVDWVPAISALQAAPGWYEGLGMSTTSLYMALVSGVIPGLAVNPTLNAIFGPNLPSIMTSPAFIGAVLSTNQIIDVDVLNPRGLNPTEKSTLATETTYELGYTLHTEKGFKLGIDVYNTSKENFVNIVTVSSPASLPSSGAATLSNSVGAALGAAFGSQLPATFLAAVQQIVGGAFAQAYGTLANVPLGMISPDQGPNNMLNLNLGYEMFGKIDYFGADVAVEYETSNNIHMYANYSWISQNQFTGGDLGESQLDTREYNLNVPISRLKAGLRFLPTEGVTAGISMRHQSEYGVGLGWYNGMVPERTVFDMNVGYKFNNNVHFDLNVTNLTGREYSTFPGMPELRTSAVASLRYTY